MSARQARRLLTFDQTTKLLYTPIDVVRGRHQKAKRLNTIITHKPTQGHISHSVSNHSILSLVFQRIKLGN